MDGNHNIGDTHLIPEIIPVPEERRQGLAPNLSTRGRRSTMSRNEFLSRWQLGAKPLERLNDHAVFSPDFERVTKSVKFRACHEKSVKIRE